MHQSKTLARLLTALVAAVASVALLAPAASATEPNPGYTQFAGCPDSVESPSSLLCIRADVTGGHLQVGKKDVPIKKPLILVGGVDGEFEGFTANSKGGLSPTQQEVPGGIIGITGFDWLINFLGVEELKLYAETQLAGVPKDFSVNTVTLPIKVRLINPILGNNCFIGSTTSPITLNLTTGTTEPPAPNKPITGIEPKFSVDGLEIIHLDGGRYVENSFSAPGASGCVLKLFGFIPISLNGFVNSQAGLPAAAGTNETIQDFSIEFTAQENVY